MQRNAWLGGGVCGGEHWARVAVATYGDDLAAGDLDVFGERDAAEDCVDTKEGNAVVAIDDEADDFDAFQDPGELIEACAKRCGPTVNVDRKFADHVWVKRKSGGVIAAHRVDVLLDDLNYLFAHGL